MNSSRGFTLIEVLVVVTIVGILASVVVLGFTGDNPARRVEQETARLALLLELARDEAAMTGQQWGFDLGVDSWGFMRFDPDSGQWSEVSQSPFQRRTSDGVRIYLGGERRAVTTLRADRPKRNSAAPEIYIYSSGEVTRFELEATDDDQVVVWRLFSDGLQPVTREQGRGVSRG